MCMIEPIIRMEDEIHRLRSVIRELRGGQAFYKSGQFSAAHERDWEDEERTERRNEQNEKAKFEWDRKTEEMCGPQFGNSDSPLSAEVFDQEIRIRIGLDTLAHAAGYLKEFYDERMDDTPWVTVTDKFELASDVCRELSREEEDGSTPLHFLFDKAILDAIEDGCIGVEIPDPKIRYYVEEDDDSVN